MSTRTWMEDTPELHDRLLRNICLPTTHDTGTCKLTNPLIEAPGELPAIYKALGPLAALLANVPSIGNALAQIVRTIQASVFTASAGLGKATSRSPAEQLDDGIRNFDLRIAYSEGEFYTYHGLRGLPMDQVLAGIAAFLQSTGGEIVYLTMSHYENFGADDTLKKRFLNEVAEALGAYAYAPQIDTAGAATNDPFHKTYQEIVTLDGTTQAGSRVILVDGEGDQPSGLYWPRPYSPPSSRANDPVIAGTYTDTTDLDKMIATQVSQYKTALQQNLPFALYMTLTPSGDDATRIIVTQVAEALAKLSETLSGSSQPGVRFLGGLVAAVSSWLEESFPVTTSWTTLFGLSQIVDSQLDAIVREHFIPLSPAENNLSMIYLDFYETTDVVQLAIELSKTGTASG